MSEEKTILYLFKLIGERGNTAPPSRSLACLAKLVYWGGGEIWKFGIRKRLSEGQRTEGLVRFQLKKRKTRNLFLVRVTIIEVKEMSFPGVKPEIFMLRVDLGQEGAISEG